MNESVVTMHWIASNRQRGNSNFVFGMSQMNRQHLLTIAILTYLPTTSVQGQVVHAEFLQSGVPAIPSAFFQTVGYEADDGIAPSPVPPVVELDDAGDAKDGYTATVFDPLPVSERVFTPSDPYLYQAPEQASSNATIKAATSAVDGDVVEAPAIEFPLPCCGEAVGCGESCGHYCRPRCLADDCGRVITAYAGATFISRRSPRGRLLVRNPFDESQNLSASQFHFDAASGTESGITVHRLFSALDLDLRYLSTGEISDDRSTGMSGSLLQLQTAPPTNVFGTRNVTASYESSLRSMEANLRFRYGGGWNWISYAAGFRYVRLQDRLNVQLVNTSGPSATEALRSRTENRLAGFQIGMDKSIAGNCRWSIDGYWRAGIYGNNSDQWTSLTTPTAYSARSSDNGTAFVGELGLRGRLAVTSWLNLVGGYEVLFVDGIAVASDQTPASSATAAAPVDSDGDAIFHGATAALEFVY